MLAIPKEVGWRGFAQLHLQTRHYALTSSLIVGALWALWHLPLPLNPERGGSSEAVVVIVLAALLLVVFGPRNLARHRRLVAATTNSTANDAYTQPQEREEMEAL